MLNRIITIVIPADNKAKAGEFGAIETILNTMRVHINDAGICVNGCGALMNITMNGKYDIYNN